MLCSSSTAIHVTFSDKCVSYSRLGKRCASRTTRPVSSSRTDLYQQCSDLHLAMQELGPLPETISAAWGRACAERLAEACQPVRLKIPMHNDVDCCEIYLVGVFHRDAVNLRFVREVIDKTTPEAIGLEARQSFLATYKQLANAIPEGLLSKLYDIPWSNLQRTLDYITLEDRLNWHAALVEANDQIAAATAAVRFREGLRAGHPAAGVRGPPAAVPSSALGPSQLLCAFLGRELALSDKVGPELAAAERGVLLHGIEVDDPVGYSAMMPTGERGSGISQLAQMEALQQRLALTCMVPRVAAGFRRWMKDVPEDTDGLGPALQAHVTNLMQQCMDPEAYLSYIDSTHQLWSDEGAAGGTRAAQQLHNLTVEREGHFMRQLQGLVARGGGAPGAGPYRRMVVVLGRGHAARLRRQLAG